MAEPRKRPVDFLTKHGEEKLSNQEHRYFSMLFGTVCCISMVVTTIGVIIAVNAWLLGDKLAILIAIVWIVQTVVCAHGYVAAIKNYKEHPEEKALA